MPSAFTKERKREGHSMKGKTPGTMFMTFAAGLCRTLRTSSTGVLYRVRVEGLGFRVWDLGVRV